MSALVNPFISFPPADPIESFNNIATASYDLTAEGFTDASSISTLTDQTGNGNDATAAGSAQPTAQTESGAGIAVARFDGIANIMQSAGWTPVRYVTRIVLFKASSTSASWMVDGVTDDQGIYVAQNVWNLYAGGRVETFVAPDTNWNIIVGKFDNSDARFYINGGAKKPTIGTNTGIGDSDGFTLGATKDSTSFWAGDINFVGDYPGDLISDNLLVLNDLCQALADRANITWTDIT